MKKILLGVIGILTAFIYTSTASADSISTKDMTKEEIEYTLKHGGSAILIEEDKIVYSEEYSELLKEKENQLQESLDKNPYAKLFYNDSYMANKMSMIVPYGVTYISNTLSVPTFEQELYYYCGPASIKETLHYINGSSLSQGTYASHMGVNQIDGAIVWKMAQELNQNQTKHNYIYEKNITKDRFINILTSDILDSDVQVPIIMHSVANELYLYAPAPENPPISHYYVINGANMRTRNITYVDSYKHDYGRGTTLGQHTDTIDNAYASISNQATSRYIIW